MVVIKEYKADSFVTFIFENGKGVRVPLSQYATKTNRKKLTNAYSDAAAAVGILHIEAGEDPDILLVTNDRRGVLLKSSLIPEKATRSASGVTLVNLKKGRVLSEALLDFETKYPGGKNCRKLKIPATPEAI